MGLMAPVVTRGMTKKGGPVACATSCHCAFSFSVVAAALTCGAVGR